MKPKAGPQEALPPGEGLPVFSGASAGGMIREARKAQGMHIAVLAATIKVPPKKLELLEADRFDELLDPTFVRALAKAVCRALKIDPEPVLARLPQGLGYRLERLGDGLNTPLRERGELQDHGLLHSPAVWIAALLVAGAVAVLMLPLEFGRLRDWLPGAPAPAGAGAPEAAKTPGAVVIETVPLPPVTDMPAAPPAAAALPAAAEMPAAPPVASAASGAAEAVAIASLNALVAKANARAWIEVQDASRRTLIARTLQPGETIGLDGTPPLRVTVGNVASTQLTWRGRPVDLAPLNRGNVAQLELK